MTLSPSSRICDLYILNMKSQMCGKWHDVSNVENPRTKAKAEWKHQAGGKGEIQLIFSFGNQTFTLAVESS